MPTGCVCTYRACQEGWPEVVELLLPFRSRSSNYSSEIRFVLEQLRLCKLALDQRQLSTKNHQSAS